MSGKSNHYDAMVALKAVIDGLNIPDVVHGAYIQEVLDFDSADIKKPCILIAPYGREEIADSTNERDSIMYPIAIALLADVDLKSADMETRLGWRQKLRRICHYHRLNVLDCYNMKCVPAAILDTEQFLKSRLFVSGFLAQVYFQELRN